MALKVGDVRVGIPLVLPAQTGLNTLTRRLGLPSVKILWQGRTTLGIQKPGKNKNKIKQTRERERQRMNESTLFHKGNGLDSRSLLDPALAHEGTNAILLIMHMHIEQKYRRRRKIQTYSKHMKYKLDNLLRACKQKKRKTKKLTHAYIKTGGGIKRRG